MRQIKFRLWDANLKKMKIPHGSISPGVFWDEGKLEGVQSYLLPLQFTGLLDKNGVEIFEGDILGGHPHATVEVRWNTSQALFETRFYFTDFDDEGNPFQQQSTDLLSNGLSECGDRWRVIGNIYENPELTEQP